MFLLSQFFYTCPKRFGYICFFARGAHVPARLCVWRLVRYAATLSHSENLRGSVSFIDVLQYLLSAPRICRIRNLAFCHFFSAYHYTLRQYFISHKLYCLLIGGHLYRRRIFCITTTKHPIIGQYHTGYNSGYKNDPHINVFFKRIFEQQ